MYINEGLDETIMNKNLALGIIVVIVLSVIATTMTSVTLSYATDGILKKRPTKVAEHLNAPIAISGDDMYITWWTNNTGNDEVMFRASDDGGATFADKINLSNSTNSDSVDAEIGADFNYVVVSWWEHNDTITEPVARISNDNGQTFGPILNLATNGTIGLVG